MAYDHNGDLPDDYVLGPMIDYLAQSEIRRELHEVAENANLLNLLGHQAVIVNCGQVFDPQSLRYTDLGATLYEVATLTSLTGNDVAGTPTYHDPDGMKIAMETAHTLTMYSPLELLDLAEDAVGVLEEDAPVLAGFVTAACEAGLDTRPARSELRRIKSGVALMRTLHITAAAKLSGEF